MSMATPTTKTTAAAMVRMRATRSRELPRKRRDELGVLLGKRLLHLLQQTELLFGERHGFLPQ